MLIVIHGSYQHPYLFPLLQRNGTADYISQNSICHELAREIDSRPFKECCLFYQLNALMSWIATLLKTMGKVTKAALLQHINLSAKHHRRYVSLHSYI